MHKHQRFWNVLKTDFQYETPEKKCFLSRNIPGWAEVNYYTGIFSTVAINSVLARMGLYNNERWAKASEKIIKVVESSGGRLHVYADEKLSAHDGPVVYIANHMSMLDTFLLPGICLAYNNVTFVVKKELLTYPFFGPVMRAVKPIAVTRKSPMEDVRTVLKEGKKLISDGFSVIIFPQATRSDHMDTHSFSSLGVKLAQKTGVPAVPIALKTDFHSNGKFIKEIGKIYPEKNIYIKIGAPMEIDEDSHVTHGNIVGFITEALKGWGVTVS